MRRILFACAIASLAGCAMNEPTLPKIVVFFPHDSVQLDSAARVQVERAANEASKSSAALVTVAGFALAHGDITADEQLAGQRAQVVANLLQADGVAPSRIQVVPRAPSNEDASVGARRVEISIGDAGS